MENPIKKDRASKVDISLFQCQGDQKQKKCKNNKNSKLKHKRKKNHIMQFPLETIHLVKI